MEADLAARAGLPYRTIRTGQLRGRAPWTAARNLGHMRTGARQARAIMDTFRPDVCFVTGGYVCAPVVWAASRARVPVLIYLPDLEPGMAIRVLSRLAARVAVSFPEVLPWFPGKGVVTGYPVRAEFMAAAADRAAARAHFGLEPGCRTLLVFGGSRGSHSINQAVMAALPRLLDACQVIHVSGALDWEAVQAQAADLPEAVRARYHAFAYLHDDMAQAIDPGRVSGHGPAQHPGALSVRRPAPGRQCRLSGRPWGSDQGTRRGTGRPVGIDRVGYFEG